MDLQMRNRFTTKSVVQTSPFDNEAFDVLCICDQIIELEMWLQCIRKIGLNSPEPADSSG